MPSILLLRTTTMTGRSSSTLVARLFSVMPKLPSPAMSTIGTSGLAALAPMAAGKPQPIVPRPPELKKVLGA